MVERYEVIVDGLCAVGRKLLDERLDRRILLRAFAGQPGRRDIIALDDGGGKCLILLGIGGYADLLHVGVYHLFEDGVRDSIGGPVDKADLEACICHHGGGFGDLIHPLLKGERL